LGIGLGGVEESGGVREVVLRLEDSQIGKSAAQGRGYLGGAGGDVSDGGMRVAQISQSAME
jgi:hypothetical protein